MVRLQYIAQSSPYKNSSTNNCESVAGFWTFLTAWKSMFSACFSLPDSRCMSDAITNRKLEQIGVFWDSRCCSSAWVSLLFEPCAWMWNEGFPCLSADCKIFIQSILLNFSHSVLDWTVLWWILFGIKKTTTSTFRGVCPPYHFTGII